MNKKILKKLKKTIRFNSTDLGEMGIFIRTEYVFNILEDLCKNYILNQITHD